MARPLRVKYPGALYHIASRGNDRKKVFIGDGDRKHFLEVLTEGLSEFDVTLYAYVLMGNHYHLVVRTANPNLSEFMHYLNTAYTVWWNKKHRRTGHLFEGRYKGIVMQSEGYLLRVSAYVHLNPVRIEGISEKNAEERMKILGDHQWSSLADYTEMRLVDREPAVKCDEVWGELGARGKAHGRKLYRDYMWSWLVEEDKRRGRGEDVERLWGEVKKQTYLGDSAFGEWIEKLLKGKKALNLDVVGHRQWQKPPSAERVLKHAGKLLGMPDGSSAERTRGDDRRGIWMYLTWDLSCAGNVEVGGLFGVSGSAVSLQIKGVRAQMLKDGKFRKRIESLREKLTQDLKT